MPAENLPAYGEELEHCKYTLEYVEKALNHAIRKKERIDNDVDYGKRHFNAESSQSYIDLLVNTKIQDSLTLKLRNLLVASSKPYFARVDFREENKATVEKLYIGKMSLMREEDQSMVIIDWRAPVANLYYESRLGESSYLCPGGFINGELSLKRQFSIEDGILKDIFDIDITTNDQFLQSYLGANADNRLKDIVSTIQAEQNRIVRADMWTPLIVQGVAGSGKTTIALHRIAYLIYTYEKSFEPENFMIIAPSRLFLNYISEVLPELGVERVKQTTFEDFAMELIGKKFKVRDANEKLMSFANHNVSPEQSAKSKLLFKASELKTSILFKDAIDDYLRIIEESYIPKEDFTFAGKIIFKHEEINRLFLDEYRNWPFVQRLGEIKKHLTNRIKTKKEAFINQLQDQCDTRLQQLRDTMQDSDQRQQLIIKAIDKKNEIIGKLEAFAKNGAKEYIGKISRLDPSQYYKDFIMDAEIFERLFEGRSDKEVVSFARAHTEEVLKSGFIEIEDFAPIIYLKYRIYGMDEKIPVKHIVIDEAQDFSVFQFFVLRKIVKDSSFTILGDLSQGIHSYRGTRNWDDIRDFAFEGRKSEFLTLEQSYRTTVEIVDAANKVLEKIKDISILKAVPVIRHGDKVEIIGKESPKEIAADISEKMQVLKSNGLKSLAVICKTMEECKVMLTHLKKQHDGIYIITGTEKEYKGGIAIVPSYLAKGLEFDAVMIANASIEEYHDTELDIKLLYVAMTRPLHRLYIYYSGTPSPLLEGI